MDRPTVLLQGTTVHESFGTVLVGALVRPFRGVSPPVDDQVAGGAEVLAANLALENFTQFLLINHTLSLRWDRQASQGLKWAALR